MAKIIELTKFGGKKKGGKKYMFLPRIKFGVSTLGFFTVLIICTLAILYLIQANRTATYGFDIEEYDNKIKELEKERQALELQAAKLRSTNKIKEKIENLNMMDVDPTKIAYLKIKKEHLAID